MAGRTFALAALGATALIVLACGSSDGGGDGSSSGGSSGSSGEGTSGGTSGGASGTIGSSGSSGATSGDLGGCGATTQSAQQLPLDLYVMLDASGSMMEQTSTGSTKWSAVKTALSAFVNDGKSAGIGVGLQIFPIQHAGAPSICTTSTQCQIGGTNYGICTLKACKLAAASDPYAWCNSSADCAGGVACEVAGRCVKGNQLGANCLQGDPLTPCPAGFQCLGFSQGTCDKDECFASDYTALKVPIAALPGNAPTFTSSMNAIPDPAPTNFTPTSMAEQSAVDGAKAYAAAHPQHVVVVVLATDGLPTRCAPLDIPGIAAIAASGVSAGVKTFVIGVTSPVDPAYTQTNLDAIATGGGTSKSFIVSTSGNVTAQFQAALDTIRGSALPCEYAIPPSEAGAPDYGKVNVQYTSGAGVKDILLNKPNAGGCDANGGWYYDVDPAQGTPTKIVVCPSTCDAIKKDTGSAKVDILLGCATVVK